MVAFSVGEEELSGLDDEAASSAGLAAWNYFMSVNTPANKAFIDQWHTFIKNPKRTVNDPMEAHYIGFNLWVKAVQKAGSTDVDKVLAAPAWAVGAETSRAERPRCCRTTTSPSRS